MLNTVRNLQYLSLTLVVVTALSGCSRTTSSASAEIHSVSPQQLQQTNDARQQMELIPPPSKTRYMAVKSLASWENPYVTVQGSMLTLHILLADANTSDLGEGGILRPLGARRQDLNIRVSDLPTALNAVPQSAWPYGRVIAVEEAHNIPTNARPEVRRNVETTMKMLNDLGVVVYEWTEGGAGLR
jgi:hypothetical protein